MTDNSVGRPPVLNKKKANFSGFIPTEVLEMLKPLADFHHQPSKIATVIHCIVMAHKQMIKEKENA
jgi:hypothetical protein